jgi:2-polyprenyl-6-methoxyphenol hydroxylase-like FAD-dependent oxidoreductase
LLSRLTRGAFPGTEYGFSKGRNHLLDILAKRAMDLGADVRFWREVEDPSEFADADLIVACDGVNSRVRQLYVDNFRTSVEVGHNNLQAALKAYEEERRAAMLPLQGAARNSARWFENVRRHIDQEAMTFAYSLVKRRQEATAPVTNPWHYQLHWVAREIACWGDRGGDCGAGSVPPAEDFALADEDIGWYELANLII